MGHAEPFAFADDYRPADGDRNFLTGTPSILALAALDAGLATFDGIAMADLRRSRGAVAAVRRRSKPAAATMSASPPRVGAARQPRRFRASRGLCRDAGADRARRDRRFPRARPDAFGFAPLYNGFAEVWRAAAILADIIHNREWDQPRFIERARSPDRRVPVRARPCSSPVPAAARKGKRSRKELLPSPMLTTGQKPSWGSATSSSRPPFRPPQ